MKSLHHFIVEPKGSRYSNTKDVEGKNLIINSENQNHEFVNRKGIVLSTPIAYDTDIKQGAEVIVHHNVFRRWSDVKGRDKNSKAFLSDNKYLVSPDQLFLYKNDKDWKPLKGFCFVQPLLNDNKFEETKEHPDRGVVVYTDGIYEKGEVVGYTPFSQYEFIIDGQRLFRVYNKFITIKYGHQGNKETYNPSWAQSG
tara:strand:+ start:1906 stop:2496 length:591 start_codon:yes stop_codon:yes gene_type:complete